ASSNRSLLNGRWCSSRSRTLCRFLGVDGLADPLDRLADLVEALVSQLCRFEMLFSLRLGRLLLLDRLALPFSCALSLTSSWPLPRHRHPVLCRLPTLKTGEHETREHEGAPPYTDRRECPEATEQHNL